MSEKPHDPYEGLSQEEIEKYEAYMADHPEEVTPPEKLRDYKEIAWATEKALMWCEENFPIAELFAITNLTPAEAPNHPTREPARKSLINIVTALKVLKEETNIPEDEYDALNTRYRQLSRAVGIINNGVVDHTR